MKNKKSKLFYSILAALVLTEFGKVNAQSLTPGKLRLGIGVEGLLPVGNTATTENFGLGITPRLQYGISDKVALTFTSGLYHFFPKTLTYPGSGSVPGFISQYKSDIIPVKAGIKFSPTHNFYLSGEAGAAFETAKGGAPVHFLWSPGIGYATKRWDVGARYENFSGNGYSDGVAALRVAYGFGL